MRLTRIVTSFIQDDDKFLIVKRSNKVKMSGLWSGISGIIEGDEEPLHRAKIEIFEELGITDDKIRLVKAAKEVKVTSSEYKGQWEIFPFLFSAKNPTITLNWENSQYRWATQEEIKMYKTVPSLNEVLFNLL